jgi:hypothetical protein
MALGAISVGIRGFKSLSSHYLLIASAWAVIAYGHSSSSRMNSFWGCPTSHGGIPLYAESKRLMISHSSATPISSA